MIQATPSEHMEALLIDVLAEVLPLSGRVDLDPLAFPQRVGLVPGHCFIRADADGGTIKHVTGERPASVNHGVAPPHDGSQSVIGELGEHRRRNR